MVSPARAFAEHPDRTSTRTASRLGVALVVVGVGWVAFYGPGSEQLAEARAPSCPTGMSLVDPSVVVVPDGGTTRLAHGHYCIDRYEGSLVEVAKDGEHPFSPFEMVRGRRVRAVSHSGVVPQAYLSRNEAEVACKESHKRLCTEEEWVTACRGKRPTTYPYGDDRKPGFCNDDGKSPLQTYYPAGGADAHGFEAMNDPRLNALDGTVAHTGAHPHCHSSWGAFDMMGNLHEWIADPAGTFLGGYYLDTHINGDGCDYKTVAHDADYHDYSTGFRCCADAK